jgi:hypothetical protein
VILLLLKDVQVPIMAVSSENVNRIGLTDHENWQPVNQSIGQLVY